MVITWDERKRLANLDKHGLDFAELTPAFFEGAVIGAAKKGRFVAIGPSGEGSPFIVVIFSLLGKEAISIVSTRPAKRKERRDARQEA